MSGLGGLGLDLDNPSFTSQFSPASSRTLRTALTTGVSPAVMLQMMRLAEVGAAQIDQPLVLPDRPALQRSPDLVLARPADPLLRALPILQRAPMTVQSCDHPHHAALPKGK